MAELDERRLYLDLGYSSLFAYCTEALGFCKSTAGRRIAAARVCRRYPEAFLRVAKGELQLSVLSVLGSYLNADNAAALFEACSGKSFERVEELLATLFPRPDVRDSIRRLPDAPRRTPDIGTNQLLSPAEPKPNMAPAESPREAALAAPTLPARIEPPRPSSAPAAGRVEPLSLNRFGVHFTADAEFRELLEEVRALASHQHPRGELMPIIKLALEAYREALLKKRFALGAKARSATALITEPEFASSLARSQAKRTRRIPAAVRRAVYERDCGACTFVSCEGRRCGARQFLELDHVQPWASRGESTVDNLRLRCRAHNQQSAHAHFGVAHMRAAVNRARRKRDASAAATTTAAERPEVRAG